MAQTNIVGMFDHNPEFIRSDEKEFALPELYGLNVYDSYNEKAVVKYASLYKIYLLNIHLMIKCQSIRNSP